MNQQPIIPEVIDLSLNQRAQHELDMKFLSYLEQHAIINKCGYEYKSEEDRQWFHMKYTDTLNYIRAKYGLSPIQLSKSTLERIEEHPLEETPEKPKQKKRGRKPKPATPEPEPDQIHFVVPDVNGKDRGSITHERVNKEQLDKMMNELAKATRTLNRIINIVNSFSGKL